MCYTTVKGRREQVLISILDIIAAMSKPTMRIVDANGHRVLVSTSKMWSTWGNAITISLSQQDETSVLMRLHSRPSIGAAFDFGASIDVLVKLMEATERKLQV